MATKRRVQHFDNKLYYGDNLDVLRNKIHDETVDLCYIDPPFNSKRNYFQIYNNIGTDGGDKARWTHIVEGADYVLEVPPMPATGEGA